MSFERYDQLKSMIIHYLECLRDIELKTDTVIEGLNTLDDRSLFLIMDRFIQTKSNLSVLKDKAVESIITIEKEKWEREPLVPPPFFD